VEQSIQGVQKRIWFLWLQGLRAAPMVVQHCYQTWKLHHPQWQITLLTEENIADYVTVEMPAAKLAALSKNHFSNLIRMKLLLAHGGVWADATTFCMRPLETWLHCYLDTGFFAFRNPDRDRIVSNWFMASRPGHPLLSAVHDAWLDYWVDHDLNNNGKELIVKLLSHILNRDVGTTRYWFSPIVTEYLRVYPYFFFHYIFAEVVRTHPACAALWNATPAFSADIPHKVQHAHMLNPPTRAMRRDIDRRIDPLYKLTWKFPQDAYREGSALHYLLSTLPAESLRDGKITSRASSLAPSSWSAPETWAPAPPRPL